MAMMHCPGCGRPVNAVKAPPPSRLLIHVLLTAFTCGLWAFMMLADALAYVIWPACPVCGCRELEAAA